MYVLIVQNNNNSGRRSILTPLLFLLEYIKSNINGYTIHRYWFQHAAIIRHYNILATIKHLQQCYIGCD